MPLLCPSTPRFVVPSRGGRRTGGSWGPAGALRSITWAEHHLRGRPHSPRPLVGPLWRGEGVVLGLSLGSALRGFCWPLRFSRLRPRPVLQVAAPVGCPRGVFSGGCPPARASSVLPRAGGVLCPCALTLWVRKQPLLCGAAVCSGVGGRWSTLGSTGAPSLLVGVLGGKGSSPQTPCHSLYGSHGLAGLL